MGTCTPHRALEFAKPEALLTKGNGRKHSWSVGRRHGQAPTTSVTVTITMLPRSGPETTEPQNHDQTVSMGEDTARSFHTPNQPE